MNSDLTIVFRATATLYKASLRDAWRGFSRNWRIPLFHIILIIPISFLFQTMSFLFTGLAGSFIAGFVFALLIASYLATVAAAARNETLQINEIWSETMRLFSPVISLLFLFFLVSFILGMTIGAAVPLLMLIVKIGFAVFLNPVPEEIITRGSSGMETVRESFDFIRENFLEWFFPWTICFLLFIAPFVGSYSALRMILMVEPLSLVRSVFFLFNPNDLLSNPLRVGFIAMIFFLLYFVFVFRAVLYYKLATSSRRKRVYQFRSGEIS